MRLRFRLGLLTLTACITAGWFWWQYSATAHGSWGIDAVLTRHASALGRLSYYHRLSDSGVGLLRERDVGSVAGAFDASGEWSGDVRRQFRDLKQRGFKVVAFASLPFAAKPKQLGNQLPEDLLQVYEQGRFLGHEFTGLVDAWEMLGEPDIGYCSDLPDRVAAYQKALYLGLKAGARDAQMTEDRRQGSEGSRQSSAVSQQRAPLVLMGALGMPPGPWLQRAAANGLLDYTDAYNFHFYGHAADLTGVIQAHREAIRRLLGGSYPLSGSSTNNRELITDNQRHAAMPLWITEAGIEAVDKKDFLNPGRRQLQANFTISTAKQALAAEDVAVFMPFILVHEGDPYAMTLSPFHTLPAWDAYAKFTRENPWPKRPLAREPHEVNPVVVQWLPDNATCVPHKVSGTYRFKEGQPIKGELRIYNFSDKPAKGRLELGAGSGELGVRINEGNAQLEIPAIGMVSIPLEFTAIASRYFREEWSAQFVRVASGAQVSGFRSQVSFGLEAEARLADFTEEPLALTALPNGVIRFPQIEPHVRGQQVGVWTTINGLKGEAEKLQVCSAISAPGAPSGLSAPVSQSENRGQTPGGQQPATARSQVSTARFWIEQPNTDPLAPTMAVAGIDGLPTGSAGSSELGARSNAVTFIRLQLDKPMTKDRKVLVVLVDDRGQRYTIWENFGADYYGSRNDIWLNLEDFHADFWGRMSADYQFSPERIREVHLRFYLNTPDDRVGVKLSVLKAKS